MTQQDTPDLPPLILTLVLDTQSAAFFDALRTLYFPPQINYLKAHLTLFHKLPVDQPEAMTRSTELISNWSGFSIKTTGLINLGRGVAFRVASNSLEHLHLQLKQIWRPWLSGQDNQKLTAHITVQNKVEPWEARDLLEALSKDFQPFESSALGIDCFEYLGGPWKFKFHIPFRHL